MQTGKDCCELRYLTCILIPTVRLSQINGLLAFKDIIMSHATKKIEVFRYEVSYMYIREEIFTARKFHLVLKSATSSRLERTIGKINIGDFLTQYKYGPLATLIFCMSE